MDRNDLTRKLMRRESRRRQDAQRAVYLRPLGDGGLHLVSIDGQAVEATSTGRITLKRGTLVTVVSPQGSRRRKILTGAPSGGQGISAYPSVSISGTRPLSAVDLIGLPPPVEEFEDLPPGFGGLVGYWGRYGTVQQLDQSTAFAVGRTLTAIVTAGAPGEQAPHPEVNITPGGAIENDPGTWSGAPILEGAGVPALFPPQGTPPAEGTYKTNADLNLGSFGNGLWVPVSHKAPEYRIYNDSGEYSPWLVYPASTEELAFNVWSGATLVGFRDTEQTPTESRYAVSLEEAWQALQ